MKKLFSLFFWVIILFCQSAVGQLQYSQDREIIKVAVNSNSTYVAVLDMQKITLLNANDFSVIRSWDHKIPVQAMYRSPEEFRYSIQLFQFHPTQPNLLLYQSVQHQHSFHSEFPLDSVFLLNINDPSKKIGITGNFRFHYLDESNYASCFNYFMQEPYYYSAGWNDSINITLNGKTNIFKTNGSPKSIKLHKNKEQVAISLTGGKGEKFKLEIRNTQDYSLLYTLKNDSLCPVVTAFENEFVFFYLQQGPQSFYTQEYYVLNTKTQELRSIRGLVDYYNIIKDIQLNGNQVMFIDGNAVWSYDIQTFQPVNSIYATIMPNQFDIDGYTSKNEILYAFGNASNPVDQTMLSNKFNLTQLNVNDLSMFTSIDTTSGKEGTLTQPAITINNVGYYGRLFKLNERYFINKDKFFEVWDSRTGKKVYSCFDFDFSSISLFPDKKGENILFIRHQQDDQYQFNLFNLATGNITSKLNTVKYYDFSPGLVNCIAVGPKSWVGFDGTSVVSIDSTLNFEKTTQTSGSGYGIYTLIYLPELNQVLIKNIDSDAANLYDIKNKTIQPIHIVGSIIGYQHPYVYSYKGLDVIRYHITEQSKTGIYHSDKTITYGYLNANGLALVETNSSWADSTLITMVDHSGKVYDHFYQKNPPYGIQMNNEVFYKNGEKLQVVNLATHYSKEIGLEPVNYIYSSGMNVIGNRYIQFHNSLIDMSTGTITDYDSIIGLPHFFMRNNQLYLAYNESVGDYGENKYRLTIHGMGKDNASFVINTSTLTYPKEDLIWPDQMISSKDGKWVVLYEAPSYMYDATYTTPLLINTESGLVKKLNVGKITNIWFNDANNDLMAVVTVKEAYKGYTNPMDEIKYVVIDKTNQTVIKSYSTYKEYSIENFGYYFDGRELTTSNKTTEYYSNRSGSEIQSSKWIKEHELGVMGTNSGELYFWKKDKRTPIKKLKAGNGWVTSLQYSNNKLYAFTNEYCVSIVDLNDLSKIITLNLVGNKNKGAIWQNQDGYFMADKHDLKYMHYSKGLNTYPVEIFDQNFNRPDIILDQLSAIDSTTLKLYRDAYKTRLAFSQNITQLQIPQNGNQSVLITNWQDLTTSTSDSVIHLQLSASGLPDQYSYSSFVNGVADGSTAINKNQLSVRLTEGENYVKVYGTNAKGKSILPAHFSITYVPKTKQTRKIYYIGIGISTYQDTTKNLKYAAKDVEDIRYFMEKRCSTQKQVFQSTIITNHNATHEKIMELKKVLSSTSIDDIVIISFSGHGTLDKEKNFYFASYGMDFSDPLKQGVSMADIGELLEATHARRKLVLLDACHSGADGVIAFDPDSKGKLDDHVKEGAKGPDTGEEESTDLNSTYVLMNNVFANFARNNGATIIAAAAGNEYAYEDEKWENGVFTYCFLNGMYSLGDKGWSPKKVKITDLQDYIYREVIRLTNGKQAPTTRSENLEWDWEF